LGKYNIVRDFHYLLLEFDLKNTVSKTMSLKGLSGAAAFDLHAENCALLGKG
jgi:hypothetical protein